MLFTDGTDDDVDCIVRMFLRSWYRAVRREVTSFRWRW